MKLYSLTRTDIQGNQRIWLGLTLREVGQMVAFCAVDNIGLDRKSASQHGMYAEKAALAGQVYGLNQYEFRAVAE